MEIKELLKELKVNPNASKYIIFYRNNNGGYTDHIKTDHELEKAIYRKDITSLMHCAISIIDIAANSITIAHIVRKHLLRTQINFGITVDSINYLHDELQFAVKNNLLCYEYDEIKNRIVGDFNQYSKMKKKYLSKEKFKTPNLIYKYNGQDSSNDSSFYISESTAKKLLASSPFNEPITIHLTDDDILRKNSTIKITQIKKRQNLNNIYINILDPQ